MKNKLILVLTVLVVLAFVLTACTDPASKNPLDGEDANAAYAYISEKMNALGGFEAEMIQESIYDGETSSMEMSVKFNLENGKKGFISAKLDDDGSVLDMTYIDGTVYCLMKSSGMEIKYKSTDASMTESFDELFATFEEDEDEFSSVEFISRENGVYKLKGIATEKTALDMILEQYEGSDVTASDFSDISLTMTFTCDADGYVSDMVQTLVYTLDGEEYTEKTTCTYKNVGTVPEITAPADADSYMNADEME